MVARPAKREAKPRGMVICRGPAINISHAILFITANTLNALDAYKHWGGGEDLGPLHTSQKAWQAKHTCHVWFRIFEKTFLKIIRGPWLLCPEARYLSWLAWWKQYCPIDECSQRIIIRCDCYCITVAPVTILKSQWQTGFNHFHK